MDENKKTILIDLTSLFDQFSKRGIGIYTRQLIKRLIPLLVDSKKYKVKLIGFKTKEETLKDLNLKDSNEIDFYSLGDVKLSDPKNLIRWIKDYSPIIKRLKPDLYFAPHFERGFPTVPLINFNLNTIDIKTIVVSHDVIPIATNSFTSKGWLINLIKGVIYKFMFLGVKYSPVIISDSIFTKNELIRYGKIREDKIIPVYLGVEETFFREDSKEIRSDLMKVAERYSLKDISYFFYDSGIESNKGISELILVFKEILYRNSTKLSQIDTIRKIDVDSDHKISNELLPDKLVIVGGDFEKGSGVNIKARTKKGKRVLKQMRDAEVLDNIITTGRITDEDLRLLLFNSSCYINLSSYEGFSLGPVQAMAASVPVIASNTSCTPEVTSGGALLVNAKDTIQTVSSIEELLLDKDKLKSILLKAEEIARRYDWNKTAKNIFQIINSTK